ncbi:hypothetical protein [Sorangium sp. So ce124]|uniref:hypothetical protein n=1 Tax=Sorangium sp. So ce124 TaxID=3133280 RepID=UPI003F63C846
MATPYQINIAMDQNTFNALEAGGFYLYGFKGVQTSIQGGAPLVWFQTKTFSLDTTISWEEQYQGYTSQSAIIPGGKIKASASYDMNLSDILQVTSPAGTGTVVTGGTQNAISIANQTTTQMVCGISQVQSVSGSPVATPLCAFPLYGNMLDVFAPIQLVLLEFATTAVNTGTVIFQAFSQAALINLTSEPEVSLSFDINTGWNSSGNPNVQLVPAGANLAPLLLQSSASLNRRILAAQSAHAPAQEARHASRSNGGLIQA